MTLKIQRVWYALPQLHVLVPSSRISRNSLSTLIYAWPARTAVSHGIYLRRYQQCSFANCWNMMRVIQMINVTNNNARLTYSSFYRMNGPKMSARWPHNRWFSFFFFSTFHCGISSVSVCIWINRDFPRERDGRLARHWNAETI